MKTEIMNREIKFRAWDTDCRKMLFPLDFIEIDSDGILFRDNKILLQFTGLTDKNGKEIFEGDIVRLNNSNEFYEVKFVEGMFVVYVEFGNYPLYEYVDMDYFNVMGNIFENPELL